MTYDSTGINKKLFPPGNKRECFISKIYAEGIYPVIDSGFSFYNAIY
jgi:hypothetical protein